MNQFTDATQSNATKGAVHGALLTLALLCGAYNGCAFLKRREWRLCGNALVYVGLVGFEIWQVKRHCQR